MPKVSQSIELHRKTSGSDYNGYSQWVHSAATISRIFNLTDTTPKYPRPTRLHMHLPPNRRLLHALALQQPMPWSSHYHYYYARRFRLVELFPKQPRAAVPRKILGWRTWWAPGPPSCDFHHIRRTRPAGLYRMQGSTSVLTKRTESPTWWDPRTDSDSSEYVCSNGTSTGVEQRNVVSVQRGPSWYLLWKRYLYWILEKNCSYGAFTSWTVKAKAHQEKTGLVSQEVESQVFLATGVFCLVQCLDASG